jgi:predicted ArsR family transcriptional regulator
MRAQATHELTAAERRVLGRLRRLVRQDRQAPTRGELARSLGISAPTAHQHLHALAEKGVVRIFDQQHRGAFPAEAPIAWERTRHGYDRAVLAASSRRRA